MTNQIKSGMVPSYDAVEEALQTLDAIHSSGRINYNDYCELHDAITNIEEHSYYKNAISRQEAIDAMAELQGEAATKAELTGISKAWKRIKKLPPVSPEQWIPYGPETEPAFGCYLVTCKNGGIYTGAFTECGWDIDDVVAYNTMVLPKAYKI